MRLKLAMWKEIRSLWFQSSLLGYRGYLVLTFYDTETRSIILSSQQATYVSADLTAHSECVNAQTILHLISS